MSDAPPTSSIEVSDRPTPSPRDWRAWLATVSVSHRLSSFLVSLAIHMSILLLLSLLAWQLQNPVRLPPLQVIVQAQPKPAEVLIPSFRSRELDAPAESNSLTAPTQALSPQAPNITAPTAGQTTPEQAVRIDDRADQLNLSQMLQRSLAPTGGGFEGRTSDAKGKLLAARGGTPESENAVAMGLAWLAAHQLENGSWHFNLNKSPCQGLCRHAGTIPSTTGATGLALLPFLGAGHTHKQGEYKDVVRRGLYYLSSRMIVTDRGGDLQEGTMYAQGVAAIALCEAYAMTGDDELRTDAQRAIDFICAAQHSAGGWRYFPGQPGDTTVTGWQLMALKSARIGKRRVPSPVIERARAFLDSVQTAGGAQFGYLNNEKKSPGPTAVGLLCRMYLGWRQDDERLARGAAYLSALGPSKNDVYFNYYATQVLSHHDGQGWPAWNTRLREFLIAQQDKRGHERGSWFFEDDHSAGAGRLYTTAMCVMTLEVYYRHMPLYGSRALDDEF